MKHILTILVTISLYYNGIGQNAKRQLTKEAFLMSSSDDACKCIDSVETYDKAKNEVSDAISKCIDKQVVPYMTIGKLSESLNNPNDKDGAKITVNVDQNSKEYKDAYFDIERYLMENCSSLKEKVASIDKLGKQSMSENPEAIKYYELGVSEAEKENYKGAMINYEKALAIDPKFAFAWDNLGLCNRKLGNYDRALYAYQKSLEIDPNGVMPLQNIAVVYIYKKDYKSAIKSFEKLSEIDKRNPEIYYGIGQIYYEYLKDYEKSLDNMCKAYNLYVELKSPYRTDAEKIIQMIHTEMKNSGKEKKFNEILKKNNISAE